MWIYNLNKLYSVKIPIHVEMQNELWHWYCMKHSSPTFWPDVEHHIVSYIICICLCTLESTGGWLPYTQNREIFCRLAIFPNM